MQAFHKNTLSLVLFINNLNVLYYEQKRFYWSHFTVRPWQLDEASIFGFGVSSVLKKFHEYRCCVTVVCLLVPRWSTKSLETGHLPFLALSWGTLFQFSYKLSLNSPLMSLKTQSFSAAIIHSHWLSCCLVVLHLRFNYVLPILHFSLIL